MADQQGPPQGGPFPGGMPVPGQAPTPEQIAELQRRIAEDAEKAGMTIPEFIEHIKAQRMRAMQQAAMQQQMQQHGHSHEHGDGHGHDHDHDHNAPGHTHDHQQGQPQAVQSGQPQPITPGPPNPKAIALAQFLRGQDLKPRTVILSGERKEMFKGTKPIAGCNSVYIT